MSLCDACRDETCVSTVTRADSTCDSTAPAADASGKLFDLALDSSGRDCVHGFSGAAEEMGARITVLEAKIELLLRPPAHAAVTPAAAPAPAFVFTSPQVPQSPTAIETQLRNGLQEAKAVIQFQAARWATELEKLAVREKEMAELRALLAIKLKENEKLKAALPITVYDPTEFGPRAQLTSRQQEQSPQQEEDTVSTVEVEMATPTKVTSQQRKYDASPEERGSVSRAGGRSRSPSPVGGPIFKLADWAATAGQWAAAAIAGRDKSQSTRQVLWLQGQVKDASPAADTEQAAAAAAAAAAAEGAAVAAAAEALAAAAAAAEALAAAAAAAAEAEAEPGDEGTGSGQFRVGGTESDEDSEEDEEVSEPDDYRICGRRGLYGRLARNHEALLSPEPPLSMSAR